MPALRVRYQTLEFGAVDIHVLSLRDAQEFQDTDGAAAQLGISSASWSLFGVVWDSGQVLAHLMFDYEIAGLRVLEVGCGLALASLVLNHRKADITATDYHPEAGGFLTRNTALNGGDDIPFVRTGWDDGDCGMGLFDLIIGADLLYERSHVESLSAFIDQHARPTCEVLIVDPGREQRGRFSTRMVELGFSESRSNPQAAYLEAPFRGQLLRFGRTAP